jgi:hypothetical protein
MTKTIDPGQPKLQTAGMKAANRAEATAILIRLGYRVYRPEAEFDGADLVVRLPRGALRSVQLKGRPCVDKAPYGGRDLWMLYPTPRAPNLDEIGILSNTTPSVPG